MTPDPPPPPAVCLDCGRPYADFPIDVLLPRSQWLIIHPDEHGLLCAQCIVTRASRVPGATGIHAIIEVKPSESPASSTPKIEIDWNAIATKIADDWRKAQENFCAGIARWVASPEGQAFTKRLAEINAMVGRRGTR